VEGMSSDASKALRKTLMRIFKDLKLGRGGHAVAAMSTARRIVQSLLATRELYMGMVSALVSDATHLAKGLGKLSEAEVVVDRLSKDVESSRQKLESK